MIIFDIKTGKFVEAKKPDPVMLSGEGPPSDIGNDGDFYVDTLTLELYGPKNWGVPVAIMGKDGMAGADGKDGLDGKNGIDGLPGMDGKDGADGIGVPGIAGRDGREIELGTTATHFQWRYIGEDWIDLFPLPKNLTGATGGGRMRLKDLEGMLEAGSNISLTTVNKKIVIASTGGGGGYTDEQAQDAVGTILVDSSEIDFTYSDATPSITASLIAGSIDETKLDASVNTALKKTMGNVFIKTPANETIYLIPYAVYGFTINGLFNLSVASGSLTLTVKINGVNVTGLSSLSVTSTPQNPTASAANTVSVGDEVSIVVSAISSPADLKFTMEGKK